MNRPNALVVESNIPAAAPRTQRQAGRGEMTPQQRREAEDITAWLEEQDAFEVEFLVAEMANKNSRAYRRSMSY